MTAQPSTSADGRKSSHASASDLVFAVAPLLALSSLAVFCHEASLPGKWVADSEVVQDVVAFHAAVEALAGQDAVAGGSTYLCAAVRDSHLSPAVLASQVQYVNSIDLVPLAWSTLVTAPAVGDLTDSPTTLGLQTMPNTGAGDCFWLAVQSCTHLKPNQARRSVAEWLTCHPRHPAYPDRAGLAAQAWVTGSHVNATVQAMPCSFSRALLVFHGPAGVGVLFEPNAPPCTLSLTEASALVRDNAAALPQLLSYTEDSGVLRLRRSLRLASHQSAPTRLRPLRLPTLEHPPCVVPAWAAAELQLPSTLP